MAVMTGKSQLTSVIAKDLRGFGASVKPDWPARSAYSAEAQARNVLALLDQLQLEGIGHFVPFEAPDALVEAIRTVL
jgi:pimeloyl-ACP methyl ester carboxylesterase